MKITSLEENSTWIILQTGSTFHPTYSVITECIICASHSDCEDDELIIDSSLERFIKALVQLVSCDTMFIVIDFLFMLLIPWTTYAFVHSCQSEVIFFSWETPDHCLGSSKQLYGYCITKVF